MGLSNWLLHSAYYIILIVLGSSSPIIDNYNNKMEGDTTTSSSSGDKGKGGEGGFQMPLHYPRYRKHDYEMMEEWKIDLLLHQYGLTFCGTLPQKRAYAMGAFLWPNQL
ncbi:hypothetical protein LguiB_026323 [Lonicera macranthoides]